MEADLKFETTVPRRAPETVMRLARMGAFHQTRLSFMRTLLRRLKSEDWDFERPVWRVDDQGVGVYTAAGPDRTYSLICYANDLDPAKRSDRVIAEEWDAAFALYDGVPGDADIQRLAANVPKQEAGRVTDTELCLSRANRSVRLFDHVVDRLASGKQPDPEQIETTGYLMRTTAVYGSGKFGAADRLAISDRPELSGPFRAEMLLVYLVRWFTLDIVEHLAKARAPETAIALAPDLRRRLGVGNSTGLGMAPFLLNHPVLINNWMMAPCAPVNCAAPSTDYMTGPSRPISANAMPVQGSGTCRKKNWSPAWASGLKSRSRPMNSRSRRAGTLRPFTVIWKRCQTMNLLPVFCCAIPNTAMWSAGCNAP